MDTRNLNRYGMTVSVQQFMDNNSTVWSTFPIITNLKNELDTLLTEIDDKLDESERQSQGITATKNQLKRQIAEKAAYLNGLLTAYAHITENTTLAENLKYPVSEIMKQRDVELANYLAPLVETLNAELPNLVDYNITQAQVTDLETSIDDFRAMVGQPREIRSAAHVAGREAEAAVNEAVELLDKKMDNAMLLIKPSNPTFYENYRAARVIVDN